MAKDAWNKGIPITDEARAKLSASLRGRVSPNKGKRYPYKARPKAKGRKVWMEGKVGIFVGDKAHNWQGGLTLQPGYRYRMSGRPYEIRRRGATGKHTEKQWIALKEQYGHMCLCCKKTEPFIELTRDHVIPLSKGGSDNIGNIQPLCRACNSQKWAFDFDYRPLQHAI